MLKKNQLRPLSGISKPEVEKVDSTNLSEAELSNRLDSIAQINSSLDSLDRLDRLEVDEKIESSGAALQEIAPLDDAVTKSANEPSNWAHLLTIDIETSEPSLYKAAHYVTPTLTERGNQSPIIIQSGGIFKQNTFFGNDWDIDSVRLLCKRIMVDSFLFSLGFSFSLLVVKSAIKSIIITVREDRETFDELSSFQRLRGGGFVERAFDHFLREMESKIDEFLNNPAGALLLKRLIMIAVFGSSSGYIVWLVYCLSIRFGISSQAHVDQSMRSLKNFSEAWASFIISAALIAGVGTVFGLLILSAWSMYIDISAFEHSRKNALLERERIEKQRLLNIEKESMKLMERLSKLDKSKLEKFMEQLSKKKVPKGISENLKEEKTLDNDKETQLKTSDKVGLKIRSINEASRKLLFYTCPNLYQSEYTGANLGSPSERAVFNFLSGENVDTVVDYINKISESQLREELGEIDENQSTSFLLDQSLCLVAIRIGLIKEFMPELYIGFDKDLRKFLDALLVKGFKRCALHAENADLFDYGGQENLISDKPKFALFQFDLPLSSTGYGDLRGGSSSTNYIPSPTRDGVKDRHRRSLVRLFEGKGYAVPNPYAGLDGSGTSETRKNRTSIVWERLQKDRSLGSAIDKALNKHLKARYGPDHTLPIHGSKNAVSVFAHVPEVLADEHSRLQRLSDFKTPPLSTGAYNEIARRELLSDLSKDMKRCDVDPENPFIRGMAKAANKALPQGLAEIVERHNQAQAGNKREEEKTTLEIKVLGDKLAKTLMDEARKEQPLRESLSATTEEKDKKSIRIAELFESLVVGVLEQRGPVSQEEVIKEAKRVLRRLVESNECVRNYEQLKYMIVIFLLRRFVNTNSSFGQKLRAGLSEAAQKISASVCSFFSLVISIPEAIIKTSPEEVKSWTRRKLDGKVSNLDLLKLLAEIRRWSDGIPSEMKKLFKEFGGTRWDEKMMSIVLTKKAGFDTSPLTEEEKPYVKVADKLVQDLLVDELLLQKDSLLWQLAKAAQPVDGGSQEISLTQLQQAVYVLDYSLFVVDGINKGHEVPQGISDMRDEAVKLTKLLEFAAKKQSEIKEFPQDTQTTEETPSNPLRSPQIELVNTRMLEELSGIKNVSRGYSIDREDKRMHGFFGHYDNPDGSGNYTNPTQNILWACLGVLYNPGFGQFDKMENPPFEIYLKQPFSGNVSTNGYYIENGSRGSATCRPLYIMVDNEDGNGAVERPLINIGGNGGLISHNTEITFGPKIREIEGGQQFDIPALARTGKSAALCLTQPTGLSFEEALKLWISYTSTIADGYEIAGRSNVSSYGPKTIEGILMQHCDDYNKKFAPDNYFKELIETGVMCLEVPKRGKGERVFAYKKKSTFNIFQGTYAPLDVQLLDRITLSDPVLGPGGKKIYGSSLDNESVNPATIDKLTFDPAFDLEIFRLFTHLSLVMLSTNLQDRIVSDCEFAMQIMTCCFRQKSEELKMFRGSEKEFAEKYPYYKDKDGLAAFFHEFLNEEVTPLILASQSGSDIIINENYLMRCRESNVFKRKGENDKTESKDEGNKLYRHAEKGVKSSCLRSICRKLPDYIGTVDGLELFLAMVKVEWGRGRHSKNDYVTRENGELILINDVASKNVDAFVERVRNACIEETK